jgi:hypothetical protein
MSVEVTPQPTPNPNAMKFNVSVILLPEGGRWFPDATAAMAAVDDAPLAAALFALPGVRAVFMLRDFVTINKAADSDWEPIIDEAIRLIRDATATTTTTAAAAPPPPPAPSEPAEP